LLEAGSVGNDGTGCWWSWLLVGASLFRSVCVAASSSSFVLLFVARVFTFVGCLFACGCSSLFAGLLLCSLIVVADARCYPIDWPLF
jgi:hypothetical protein